MLAVGTGVTDGSLLYDTCFWVFFLKDSLGAPGTQILASYLADDVAGCVSLLTSQVTDHLLGKTHSDNSL